jgi:hypothetical protein
MCGYASRIGKIPKFFLPIDNENSLLLNSVKIMLKSQFKIKIITTNDYCNIVKKYLENHLSLDGIDIIPFESMTMSETILAAKQQSNSIYSLIMPDTYFNVNNPLGEMFHFYNNNNCDVVLGIFKIRSDQIGKLGQVKFDNNLNLVDVIDKDNKCEYLWAWGTILWNENFLPFINKISPHIGYGLIPALESGIRIKVYKFNVNYFDCGTVSEYKALLNHLS